MKNFIYKSGMLALFATAVLTSCDPNIDAPDPSKGEADFTKYVAVGNSLTAGFSDGGLYREGQLNSYPAILAEQFKLVGGGEFAQPLFTEQQKNGSGYLSLTGFDASGLPVLKPVTTELAIRGVGADNKTPLYTEYLEPVNNLGVPGIKMTDVSTVGYGFNNPVGFNPYYERLLPNDITPTGALRPYVATAAATQPTFFTMWLGNNDVLGYATSGGLSPISDIDKFKTSLDAMVNALVGANNAKGAIINIPDVTGVPFFTTKSTAQLMQMAAANKAKLYITANDNTVREATVEDYILLTSTVGTPETVPGIPTPVPHGFTPLNPLKNNEVLDKAEVATAQAATANFNNALSAAAQARGLALVNMNTFFNTVKMKDNMPQLTINNIAYSPAFISGNIFSLDGIHLTPRGNAIVANEIIRNINATYKANIPTVDETKYRAVLFP